MSTARGVRDLALAIVASETGPEDDDTQQLQAADRLLAAVQDELVRLVGATGFLALLDRAFHKAAATQGIAVRTRPPRSPQDSIGNFRDNMHAVPANDTHGALVGVLVT